MQKLALTDLQPQEAILILSTFPEKSFTLGKFSLRMRIWMLEHFDKKAIEQIFRDKKLGEISQIAYQLLKNKSDFKTIEEFQDAIVTQKDIVGLVQAVLTTLGLSEPVIEKLAQEIDSGNEPSPDLLTGAQPTISSQPNTDTA